MLFLRAPSSSIYPLDLRVERVSHYQYAKERCEQEGDGHALFVARGVRVVVVVVPTPHHIGDILLAWQELGRLLPRFILDTFLVGFW